MNIVILAAGIGKRMQSTLPKVLNFLAGKPLLTYVIETAKILKPTQLCVVYGYGEEVIRDTFAHDTSIFFIKQNKPLGTGHAIMQVLPYLNKTVPTLVLYGDVPLIKNTTLQKLIIQAGKNKIAILTIILKNPTNYGRIIRNKNKIVRIIEQKDANTSEQIINEVNTGIIVAPTALLHTWLTSLTNNNTSGEYYLTDIIAFAVADNIEIVSIQSQNVIETFGVNNKFELAKLERLYQRDLAYILMKQGVTLFDPNRLDIRGFVHCGRDISIDVNCIFEGTVNIDNGAIIDSNCFIRNSTIGKNVHIKAFSFIDGAIIETKSQIGPYAHLRPGTILSQNVHIGNFVEVKNSKISDHTKANHLSYIGDTTIGSHVNVGAGVITCNYNSIKKSRTIIDDNAFIGSDTQLIAPVHVGKNAMIGAGTTLTKNAPKNKLTLSRTKQRSISKWKVPKKN